MKAWAVVCAVCLCLFPRFAFGQSDPALFGRKNTFGVFFDYSNDSSHIVLGAAQGRRFTELGFQYERRLLTTRHLVWKYDAEVRPLIGESDLTVIETVHLTSPPPGSTTVLPPIASPACRGSSNSFSYTDSVSGATYAGVADIACGARWTYVEGVSPVGTRINLFPHRRWQPTGDVLTGLLLSAKRIPVDQAGSFNFMFQVGAGVEYYRNASQSIRLEYQLQHFSNAYTASANPGVDNGLFKVTCTFGIGSR